VTETEAKRARKLLAPIVAESLHFEIFDRSYDVGRSGKQTGVMIEIVKLGLVRERFYTFKEVEAFRAKWNERQEALGKSPLWK
jgi:hypothetical protein